MQCPATAPPHLVLVSLSGALAALLGHAEGAALILEDELLGRLMT
jgi:hypothetical protein